MAVSLLTALLMAVDTSSVSNTMVNLDSSTTSSPLLCGSTKPCPSERLTAVVCKPTLTSAVMTVLGGSQRDQPCSGMVSLSLCMAPTMPVCSNSITASMRQRFNVNELCSSWRCGEFHRWEKTRSAQGYLIKDNSVTNVTCNVLEIRCKPGSMDRQLAAYKISTALLCTLLLVLILISFGPSAYKATLKRISNRRKDRWIGPTQSHSVSFHRPQSAVHPSHSDKRQSCLGEPYA